MMAFWKKSLQDFGKYCNVSAVPLQPSLLETSIRHDTFLVLPKCRSIFNEFRNETCKLKHQFVYLFSIHPLHSDTVTQIPCGTPSRELHVSKSLQTSGSKVQHETSKMMISKTHILSRGSFSGFISYSAKGP